MSVKRGLFGGRKKQRRRKKIVSNYVSVSRRRERSTGKLILVVSLILAVLGGLVIGFFALQRYLKNRPTVPEGPDTAEASLPSNEPGTEGSVSVAEETTESTEESAPNEPVPPEKSSWELKMEKQAEFEEYVHSIQPGVQFTHYQGEPTLKETGDPLLDEANRLAAGYDYDAAIELIRSVEDYGNITRYNDAIAEYTAKKSALKPFQINNNITTIFFHSLIADPTRAFDPSIAGDKVNDYNLVMTTIDEFAKIMDEMYANNFVLVDIYDVARMEEQPDGTKVMRYQQILLPEGKKPFILSVDDLSYYEYMTGHGYPSKLVVGEDGKVTNEMTLVDGTVIQGSFDVLPCLEDFIEMHPDFSYRGGRAIAALTGYNGVLGYRTCDFWYNDSCEYYEATEANEKYKREEISGPNPNIEKDKEEARKVAEAIKAMGWHFASHSWGHKNLGSCSMETFNWDADMWDREVRPILGEETDILIFPFGADIGSWRGYTYEGYNERYDIMKNKHGFDYFLNVDSNQYFMQRTDEYMRFGRRNVDGERLWEAVKAEAGDENYKDRLDDLFKDATAIIDPLRPELD